ncbi:Cyclin-dependent kinase 20 [Chlorella vulgaris]
MTFFDVPGADEYEVEEEVGHGTFSEVHRARHRTSGDVVALKHMFLQEEGVLPLHVQRELQLLRSVRHPAVIGLLQVKQQGFSVALVLEHCLIDLRLLLVRLRGAPLDAAVTKTIVQQLLQALATCHAAGFVHRDVAPSNILVAPSGAVKLADFGQARRLPTAYGAAAAGAAQAAAETAGSAACVDVDGADPDASSGSLTPGAALCTRWYKSPELLFNSRSYGPGVDVWGAGCILAELLTGRPLFPGTSDISQLALMSDLLGSVSEESWPGVRELPDWGKLIFREQAPRDLAEVLPGVPPEAVQLVAGLLQYNPELRLTAQQALGSTYFQQEPLPAAPAVLAAIAHQAVEQQL